MPPHRRKNVPAERSRVYDALVDLGEDQATASVLTTLIDRGPSLIRDIADHGGWSIPAIAQVLVELEEIGWVTREKVPNLKRGRDPYQYELALSKAEIRRYYKDRVRERLKTIEAAL